MSLSSSIDLNLVAQDLGLPLVKVQRTVELLDDGNTVAFVTRYRKDQTGGLDEEQIWQIHSQTTKLRLLADRKQTILKSIHSQGKLSTALAEQIQAARSTKRLEDLYLPFKPKKQTLATLARERGLEPLSQEILESAPAAEDLDARAADFVSAERQLNTVAEVLQGVGHLLAERISERADLRAKLRGIFRKTGQLVSTEIATPDRTEPNPVGDVTAAKAVAAAEKAPGPSTAQRKRQRLENALKDYSDFREPISRVPPHRVLAINRGDRAKVLRVKIEGDAEAMSAAAVPFVVSEGHPHTAFLQACLRNALSRLVLPGLEREIRRELTEKAEEHAVGVFVRNLRKLLLRPPVRGRRILAIDPGFRSGCKLAALDEFGTFLEGTVIHVIGNDEKRAEARSTLADLVSRHQVSVVAIGNGTACRETEQMVAEALAGELNDAEVVYVIVNEAGASVYSTSPIGREELSDHEAAMRSSISIGRRLLDPLSELVKINPANIGVGLYQHDVKAKHLRQSLDAVVESCVNFVGVDVNAASPSLLSYVSGLNQLTARRLYDFRREHGPFRSRDQFRQVPGIGEATFVQAAGFLRITEGENPLDATWIHPESYDVARRVLDKLNSSVDELSGAVGAEPHRGDGSSPADPNQMEGAPPRPSSLIPLVERVARVEVSSLAKELGVGELLLEDILTSLAKPGRDPRDDLPQPVFRTGIMKLEDLKPGMELRGTVLNVVDFGAFVDVGVSDSALVHISRLADRFVRDPHEVVSVGDVLKVWVIDVDKQRRRVSLTAIPPGPRQTSDARNAAPHKPSGPQPPHTKDGQRRSSAKRSHHVSRTERGAGKRSEGKPKPAKPITDAMVDGHEPMRSFSDLLQYYEKKRGPAENDDS